MLSYTKDNSVKSCKADQSLLIFQQRLQYKSPAGRQGFHGITGILSGSLSEIQRRHAFNRRFLPVIPHVCINLCGIHCPVSQQL
jgi:hypothetical protein